MNILSNNKKKHCAWNREWILTHTLDKELIEEAEINLLEPDEIFVEVPGYPSYYISQYGQAVSLKCHKVKLLGAFFGGDSDDPYLYYGFTVNGKTKTVSVHHAVAITFCPNFWGEGKRLEAHHIDKNRLHNEISNLVLLPKNLHTAIHKIKKIVLLEGGRIIPYTNPLDLVADTGLTLEEILLANNGKKKPVKSQGSYTVFDIKGNLIGFEYYPKAEKKKNN